MKNLLYTILVLLISNCIYCQEQKQIDNDDFITGVFVEKSPEYKGGFENLYKYLNTNAIYTKQAIKDSVEGRVIIQFIISKDGEILNPQIIKGIHPDLDSISLNLIKRMPRWNPAIQGRKPVSMKFTLPITFKLPSTETSKYWIKKGKRRFMKICSDQYKIEKNECDCWYKFIIHNYNSHNLNEIDLNEMFKFQDCKE